MKADYDNKECILDSSQLRVQLHFEIGKKLDRAADQHSPALLYLHGKGAHSGTWRQNIPYFAERGWTGIAPTLPRTENSDPNQENILEYANIVHEILTKLGVEQLEAAVGNSMGGWVAMQMVLAFPGSIKRLILEDSAGAGSSLPSRVDVPTMIIWGEEDTILPVSNALFLKNKIRNSSLEVLGKAGHVPHWEKPDVFNTIVERFLESNR